MSDDAVRHAMRRKPLLSPVVIVAIAALVALVLVAWLALAFLRPPGTVIVIRHVEKTELPADNPGPSERGARRAERLAEMLAPAGLDAIYASEYLRSFATASPLANRLSLPVHVYDAGDTDELVRRIRTRHGRDDVLIVGHSNTVPDIVHALSGRDIGYIPEDRYGDVFIIVRGRFGRTTLIRLYQPVPE